MQKIKIGEVSVGNIIAVLGIMGTGIVAYINVSINLHDAKVERDAQKIEIRELKEKLNILIKVSRDDGNVLRGIDFKSDVHTNEILEKLNYIKSK